MMARSVCGAMSFRALCLLDDCGCSGGVLNSLPLPGTEGNGDGAYTIGPSCPMSSTSSRIRGCGSATSRSATSPRSRCKDWHALVTMRINGDVHLPANSTAKVGQTSLLGSMHIELAPPTDEAPHGQLRTAR